MTTRRDLNMQPTTTSYASFNSDLPSYVYSCATLPCSHASKHFITTSTSSMESTGLQHQASHTAEGGSTVATLARFSYISWYHKLKISKQSMIYISIRKSNNYRPGARRTIVLLTIGLQQGCTIFSLLPAALRASQESTAAYNF